MLRDILKFGETDLHRPASPVDDITDKTRTLIDDMVETMYAAPGIGLAAPQIGVPLRIFVADLSVGQESGDLVVMVNPELVERDGMQMENEGCLSVPGFEATVVRPDRAVVRGLDRNGREHTIEGSGLLARAFQHELDHLDGRLFVDRLRGIQRQMIVRKIRKLQRSARW